MRTKRQNKPPERASILTGLAGQELATKDELLCQLEMHRTEADLKIQALRDVSHSLAESRNHFASLYNLAPVPFLTFDDVAIVRDLNAAAADFLGLKRESVLNNPFNILVAPDDTFHFLNHLRHCRTSKGDKIVSELRVHGPNGCWIPAQLISVSSVERGKISFLTVLIDLSRHLEIERALKTAREFSEAIVQTVQHPLLVLDSRWRIVSANKQFYQLFQCREEDVACRRLDQLEFVKWQPEDWIAELGDPLLRAKGLEFFELECSLWPYGNVITCEVGIRSLESELQSSSFLVLTFQNTTERRRAEKARDGLLEELKENRDNLEHHIRIRTEDLQNANNRLEQVSRQIVEAQEAERRRIACELHDEVGQRLTALKLLLKGKLRLLPQDLSLEFKETEEAIDDLVRQVRELAVELRPQVLDDLGLLAALVWHFKVFEAKTGISIIFSHSHIDEILLDTSLKTILFRVAQEALNNVAKHAQVRSAKVRLRMKQLFVRLEVSDRGIGFHPELVSKLSSGLSIMRERVSLVGGAWDLNSMPGQGTTLCIKLPLNRHDNHRSG